MHQVFIDGQAGTTGLEITARLEGRDDIALLRLSDAERKDQDARRHALRAADVAILCLPDDAAREAVALGGEQTRYIDASTAHRVADGWVYGLPEMTPEQRDAIRSASRVSNPGCYPQGFILLVRPLIEAGLLSADQPLTLHALSGYSGGGRQMIETYQAGVGDTHGARPYGRSLAHKHLPEMHRYSGCAHAPVFSPIVCNYLKGMSDHIPLHARMLKAPIGELYACLADRYAGEPFVRVVPPDQNDAALDNGFLEPTACNDTNRLEIMLFGNDSHILLTARYDNLGKGASGAAVQNLNLMLGIDERTGLTA